MPETMTKGRFAGPVDQETVATEWQSRGYSCHIFIDPPGQAWNDFVHGTNELVTVISGRLQLDIETPATPRALLHATGIDEEIGLVLMNHDSVIPPQKWDDAIIEDGQSLTLLSAFEGG